MAILKLCENDWLSFDKTVSISKLCQACSCFNVIFFFVLSQYKFVLSSRINLTDVKDVLGCLINQSRLLERANSSHRGVLESALVFRCQKLL